MTAISALLKTIPLLSRLSPTQLASVATVCERHAFSAGDTIATTGVEADAAYFLMDGRVECLVIEPDGRQTTTAIPSGATLLELAMIIEMEASATCVARGSAKVLRIPRKEMHDLMQDDIALTDKVIETLTIRLKDMADTMRDASAPFEPIKRSA